MIGWVFVHPFNTAAVRMNLSSFTRGGNANISFIPFLKADIQSHGIWSLYTGLSAGLLRQVFYATSRLGLFESFRDEMAKYRPTDVFSRLICGVASGG